MIRWMTGCGLILVLALTVRADHENDPPRYVYHLYKTILGRDPSRSEVELWTRNLVSGMKPDEARAAFLSSDEFYRHHGKDGRKFVIALFAHVHGRPGSYDELKYWGDRYWAHKQERFALSLEMIRSLPPPPPPPPPPPVVIVPPTLPPEPVPVPQPHQRLVAQAEVGIVLVELFVQGLDHCRRQPGVSGLEEQARALGAALHRLRRAGAQDEPRRELRHQLHHVHEELFRLRERHRHLGAVSSLKLPPLVDLVDSVDALAPLVDR